VDSAIPAYGDGHVTARVSGPAGQTSCVALLGCLEDVYLPTMRPKMFKCLIQLSMEISGASGWVEYHTSVHQKLWRIEGLGIESMEN
jgi:hypothetical protein